MNHLPAIIVVFPLLMSALLILLNHFFHVRWGIDLIAILTAATTTVFSAILIYASSHAPIVYWFGGWYPENGFPLGISFFIDPVSAGLATFVSLLVTLALIFSWNYFESIGTLYHSLMLIFLGSMVGFSITGDLFNLFVFFELMGAVAYALTAYKIEETGPLQGALNFTVMNTIGGITLLIGIAIIYGQTGSLNMADVGRRLAAVNKDSLLTIVALGLFLTGFFVKAAVLPFHFWLPDAHAVAPAPVSVLFSGIMVELGLYGAIRVYWTVFHDALVPQEDILRALLFSMGLVSAVIGSIMCYAQRHLKRLLAFSTVSHIGLILMALAMFTSEAFTGAMIYVISHGCIKAALFFCVGIYLDRLGSVDEQELFGQGKHLKVTGWAFIIGGLALAGMLPFGTFLGKSLMEEELGKFSFHFSSIIIILVCALTGGAVLRVGIGILWGWGKIKGPSTIAPTTGKEERETLVKGRRTPVILLIPVIFLLLIGLGIGITPGITEKVHNASINFQNTAFYHSTVMGQKAFSIAHFTKPPSPKFLSYFLEILAVILALFLAISTLATYRFLDPIQKLTFSVLRPSIRWLRNIHSGYIGDYVCWFLIGIVIIIIVMLTGLHG